MNRQAMGGSIGTGLQQSRSAAALLPILPDTAVAAMAGSTIGSTHRAGLGMPEIIASNEIVCTYPVNGGTDAPTMLPHSLFDLYTVNLLSNTAGQQTDFESKSMQTIAI